MVTFKGEEVALSGKGPKEGEQAKEISLRAGDLSRVSWEDFRGKRKIWNIFLSLDTKVCATSVRQFRKRAGEEPDVVLLHISKDLPFAQNRFCREEAPESIFLSAFDSSFGKDYGLEILSGPFQGLLTRCVCLLDRDDRIVYVELVSEITREPDYEKLLRKLKNIE